MGIDDTTPPLHLRHRQAIVLMSESYGRIMKRIIATSIAIILLGTAAVAGGLLVPGNTGRETQYLQVSWAYNYQDIAEISRASDVVALVKVDGLGRSYEYEGVPFSEFKVTVLEGVYGSRTGGSLTILMTGMETNTRVVEVIDDPLMQVGEEFLVFCKANTDGTYQILGGPEGRLVYASGKLNSLAVVNERVRQANPDAGIRVENADAEAVMQEVRSYAG